MVLATEDLLRRNPSPTRHEIREAMSGNICRCTGYQFIVDSILAAAAALRAGEDEGGAEAGEANSAGR
jgi:carbon-monoxide dehydrogenase small subunit